MSDPVKDALNALIDHWNTKGEQRVTLPPDWHAWITGVSEHIDRVIAAYKAQQRERGEAD